MGKSSKTSKSPSARRREQTARRRSWWWAGAVALVGGIAILAWAALQSAQQSADIPGIQIFSGLTFAHSSGPIEYAQIPPAGGDHSPTVLNCGIYDQPVPNENAVHSLEHGAVWITYQPTLPQASVDQLRGLVRGHDHLLLSPFPNLPAPIVASGWGVQLQLTGADDPRLPRFIKRYEQGPQTREPGAECSGGTGSPIEQ
jgi:hypothetical protein